MTSADAEIAARLEALATPASLSSTLHGPRHWRDVARIADKLQVEVPSADRQVLFLFAAAHDTQRLDDGYDPDHGARAAEVVLTEIEHDLSQERLELLVYALRHHTGGETHDDPTIGACWDADRLTLQRVEIIPRARFMSTPPVRADLPGFLAVAEAIRCGPDLAWSQIAGGWPDGE